MYNFLIYNLRLRVSILIFKRTNIDEHLRRSKLIQTEIINHIASIMYGQYN